MSKLDKRQDFTNLYLNTFDQIKLFSVKRCEKRKLIFIKFLRGKKMSLKRKIISGVVSAFAVVTFTTFVSAQDTNTGKEDNSMQKQEMRGRHGGKRMRGGRDGFGKGMHGGKHGGGDRMVMRSLGRLNLSDAQKEQIRGLSENFKASTQAQREELRALGMKKRDGIISTDEQARLQTIKTQLKTSGEQMHNSIMAILTTEQRAQLDQMKEEMKTRRQERRQNRQNQTLPPAQDN
jgi:Spy/CpxP family protein refolding chaperone